MAAQPQKRFGAHAFCVRQLGDIVQRRALCVGEQGTSPVLLQSVEFGLIHRSLDRKRPPNINAEKTNVNPRHLLANQHDGLYLLFCSFDSRRDSMLRPPRPDSWPPLLRRMGASKLDTVKMLGFLRTFAGCLASKTACMGEFRCQYGPSQEFSPVFRFRGAGHWCADCPSAGRSPLVSAAGPAPVRLRHYYRWLRRGSGPG